MRSVIKHYIACLTILPRTGKSSGRAATLRLVVAATLAAALLLLLMLVFLLPGTHRTIWCS